MNSRERVLMALKHQESDRIPRDLGGTESSGITAPALASLQRKLNISSRLKIFEPYQYVAYPGGELKARFRIDTANLTPEPRSWIEGTHPLGFDVLLPAGWNEETDDAGDTVVRRADGLPVARRPRGGYYFDPINPPLQHIEDPKEIGQYKEAIYGFDYPSFADEPLESLRKRAEAMHADGDCVVFNLCCHILAAGQLLRGYEQFMVDLISDDLMTKTLLEILMEGYFRRVDSLAPLLKDAVDIVLLNDDLGTQNGPMLSPSLYKDKIKPYQSELFRHVKKSFGKPILFHSCGAMREFIPDLIEIGVDAINPVQLSAKGMDLKELKRDFGKDISFWGGGVDTQTVLNVKSPAEVAEAVKRNLDILSPGGGFVFCQVHNIQPDVSPENISAMFEALDKYGSH